jgi:peptide/nickel transport system ATP-binding protein
VDLLDIQGLTTHFFTRSGVIKAVDNLSLTLQKGRVLGLVGESGCGKTVTALSILNLVPYPGKIVAGKIFFDGKDLLALSEDEMRSIRGARISMIFQEPMTALNPVFTVGNQIAEVLTAHRNVTRKEAMKSAVDLLHSVGIPSPEKRVNEYPHQLSGGMRQRVMIAMAIACKPSLILADEPPYCGARQRRGGHVRGPDRRAGRNYGALRKPPTPLYTRTHGIHSQIGR